MKNLKLIVAVALLMAGSATMNAQTTHDIEPAVLEVKYDVRQGVNKDLYCLRCGKKVSEYFSLNRLRNDSLIASADPALNMIVLNEMLEEAQHKNNPDKRRAASPGNNEYLYTNLKEGKISVYTSLMGTRYVTEEAIPIMEWSIMEDSAKNVCGYECHKATTNFRGRTWEVWYTDDVPVSAGPWKFGGLPGLILQATCKDFVEIKACELKNKGISAVRFYNFDNKKYELIEREKLLKTRNNPNTYPSKTIITPQMELE
ncbi:MAG: GLPGLI family protein [Prevotella sp.]|nr:GLPGLI family protein [Prevotella sp.]